MHGLLDARWLLGWAFGLSLLLLVGSLLLAPVLITRMRADYFLQHAAPSAGPAGARPFLRTLVRSARNLLGALLFALGVVMLVLPGQGLLTILAGLTLLEFPGKRRLELAIVRERHVLKTLNWIRKRAGRAPLELPARDAG